MASAGGIVCIDGPLAPTPGAGSVADAAPDDTLGRAAGSDKSGLESVGGSPSFRKPRRSFVASTAMLDCLLHSLRRIDDGLDQRFRRGTQSGHLRFSDRLAGVVEGPIGQALG